MSTPDRDGLTTAVTALHAAVDGAAEPVVAALEAAGYEVSEWGVSLVSVRSHLLPDGPVEG